MKSSIPFKHVPETGSTNQDLLNSVTSPKAEPTAILTDSQSAGRGRLGRTWRNEPSSDQPIQAMLGSTRQDWPAKTPGLSLMPLAVGLAVQSACRRWMDDGQQLGLKWPNDVVVRDEPADDSLAWFRKVAGILVEATPTSQPATTAVIIGTGINIWPVHDPDDQFRSASASLSELSSSPPTNVQLFQSVLGELERWTRQLRSDPSALIELYRQECWTIGRRVRFEAAGGTKTAVAIEVNADGSLQVRHDDGHEDTITSGDVSVAR